MNRLRRRHVFITASAALCILILYVAAMTAGTKPIGVEIPSASVFTQNIHLFSNSSAGFFLLSTNNETTKITFLNNDGSSPNSSSTAYSAALDYTYRSAELHDEGIYIYGPAKSNQTAGILGTNVTRYPLGKANTYPDSSYFFSSIKSSGLQGITADKNGYIYALNDASKSTLSVFSNAASQALATISSTNGNFTSVCVSPNCYLYTTYGFGTQIGVLNVKYSIPKNEPKLFSSDIPAIPYRFLNSTTVLDANGAIFNVQGTPPVFHKVKEIPGSNTASCALSNGNIVCKTGSRTAGEFAADGTLVSEYKFDGELLDLSTNGTVTAAIVCMNSTLRFVDLSKPTTNGEESSDISSEPEISSSSPSQTESTVSSSSVPSISSTPSASSEDLHDPAGSDPSSTTESSCTSSNTSQISTSIQSSTYSIDRNASLLYVGASTTFAQLKSGIHTNGASLRAVKPNGTIIESGNIGTGTVIELRANDQVIDSLVALVKGDLVGSGNITSRDERLLYAHLNSGNNLSNVYLQAADMDSNGTVDTTDLLLLKKLVSAG